MNDTFCCLAVCFNFAFHIMGLFQPVADIGHQARALADAALIALGQPDLDIDQFRFHDPYLQFDQFDRDLQCG